MTVNDSRFIIFRNAFHFTRIYNIQSPHTIAIHAFYKLETRLSLQLIHLNYKGFSSFKSEASTPYWARGI